MNVANYLQKSVCRSILHRILPGVAVFFVMVTGSMAAQVNLTWNPTTTYTDGTPANVSGYKVFTGTSAGRYTQPLDVGNTTSYTLSGLGDATTYYFAVTAYDTAGIVSGFSNEASFTTPALPSAPTVYTISASAGSGGSISPAGSVGVSQGVNQSFTITPNAGYMIAGVTVDGRSVGALSTYTFSNVSANHTIQATFTAATVGNVISAVNSGGSQFTDSAGVVYTSDKGFTGGAAGSTTAAITGTADDTLYQSERYGNTFNYSMPVPNGNYAVTLKFAETYFSAAGQRVFNVATGGRTVISDLDIYAKVGKNASYDVVIPVNVTNGVLSIDFISKVNKAKVCAIKVVPTTFSAGQVVFTANSGGSASVDSSRVAYLADSRYASGSAGTTTAAISGTLDDTLYQSERYGNFSYSIPMANGNYTVTLKFAEIYFAAPGKRVFNVNMNGRAVISNLDLYAKVGKNVAYDVVIPVAVTNGLLNIDFISQVNYAKVGAIIIKTA